MGNLLPKLLISFSGGETSAYMLYWILENWKWKYEIQVVFANTGQENEETLEFIEKCSEYFDVRVVWVEAVFNMQYRKGTTHKIVDFSTASRNGEPFEQMIKKHGIPNQATPHCNRELKLYAINSYLKSIGWKDYYTAIGIRVDEFDRMNAKREENKILYPLIKENPMTKKMINQWWVQQPFRLNLKGYQGNCKTCWKKSDAKLFTLAKEDAKLFDFFSEMELKYESYVPASRLDKMKKRGEAPNLPCRFFRKNRSVQEIINESKTFNKRVIDDAMEFPELNLFDLLEEESCDIYSECGIDN